MAIWFNSEVPDFQIGEVRELKRWINSVIKEYNLKTGFIDYIFVSDSRIYKINKEFLNHETYTDIITFDYSERKVLSSDIFISIERVKENASKFSESLNEELKRVIIHGILHLIGYKDGSEEEKAKMRDMEDKYLSDVKHLQIVKE